MISANMSPSPDDEEHPFKKSGHKQESWLITFADMMSLLMSFFVLLLSFSEQNAAKFKEVGGALENAFGVQRNIISHETTPKGISFIAPEFSPPRPSLSHEEEQPSQQASGQTLELGGQAKGKDDMGKVTLAKSEGLSKQERIEAQTTPDQKRVEITDKLAALLAKEILQNAVEIESAPQRVTIRILEHGSFATGDDTIETTVMPLLDKVSTFLNGFPGKITIAGYTDNVPIENRRFRSNWDLSAGRAISVAHYLIDKGRVEKKRVMVIGYSDTKPLFPNDTPFHKQQNRRVEITLWQNDVPQEKVMTNDLSGVVEPTKKDQ